jgi:hypothetical protein
VRAFHEAVVICAILVAAGGVLGAVGIVNPPRAVGARRCPGGQLVGTPQQAVESTSQPPETTVEPIPQEA